MSKRKKSKNRNKEHKPYIPLARGSMRVPLEWHGDNIADFLRVARYDGLMAYPSVVKKIYAKPYYWRIFFDFGCDEGKRVEINYMVDALLTGSQMNDLLCEKCGMDYQELIHDGLIVDVHNSYLVAELTERNGKLK